MSRPRGAPIEVARAAPGLVCHFPDAIARADGSILVAYRASHGHVRSDGHISFVESTDGGATWSPPWSPFEPEHDCRDPKLTQLRDGTLVLSYFVLAWREDGGHDRLGTLLRRSYDGARSWTAPAKVSSGLAWAASHGSVLERDDGELLVPLYGALDGQTRHRAIVVSGGWHGDAFGSTGEAVIAAVDGVHCQEPTVIDIGNGRLVALVRSDGPYAYLARSSDGGTHWGPPTRTDLPASSHHTLLLRDGAVLVTYGDTSRRFSPRRATSGRLVPDAAGDWCGHQDIPLYDSGQDDQANPSSVETDSGFLTFSFDVSAGTVVAVRSVRTDYHPSPI